MTSYGIPNWQEIGREGHHIGKTGSSTITGSIGITYTARQLLDYPMIVRNVSAAASGVTDTLPSAVSLWAACSASTQDINAFFDLQIYNNSSVGRAITIAAGSGMTIIGNSTIDSGGVARLRFVVSSNLANAATYNVFVGGGGSGAVTVTKNAITQTTSFATPITTGNAGANANYSGLITTLAATTAAGSASTITFTNAAITANSYVLLGIMSYSGTYGTNGQPSVNVQSVSAGSCTFVVYNCHGTNALNGALTIAFLVV